MLALDWLLYFSFGFVFSSMAALAVTIAQDLHLNPTELGVILGAWQLTYVVFAVAAGLALDRFGLRRTMALGALIIGASSLLRASAADFVTLTLAVALFGVGGPLISVGSGKLVSEWFRGRERGTAIGIAATGPAMGSIAVLALANSVLVPITGSWRGCFVVCAAISGLTLVVWLVFAREARAPLPPVDVVERRVPPTATIGRLVRVRNVQLLMAGAVAAFAIDHGLGNWMPTILVSHSFTPANAGLWAAIATAMGLVGSLALPRSVGAGRRRHLLAAVAIITAFAGIGLGLATGLPLLIAVMVAGAGQAVTGPLLTLLLMDSPAVGRAYTGAAIGLYYTFGELGGFTGPFLIGSLENLSGSFLLPLAILSSLALLIAALALTLSESGGNTPVADFA